MRIIKTIAAIITALGIVGTANAGNSSANTAISGTVGEGGCSMTAGNISLGTIRPGDLFITPSTTINITCGENVPYLLTVSDVNITGLTNTLAAKPSDTWFSAAFNVSNLPSGTTCLDSPTYQNCADYYPYYKNWNNMVWLRDWNPVSGLNSRHFSLANAGTGQAQQYQMAFSLYDWSVDDKFIRVAMSDASTTFSIAVTFSLTY